MNYRSILLRPVFQGFTASIALLLSLLPLAPVHANPLYASIVVDADTGAVLHESNADASRFPASLTKMMTLYMLFEAMEQRKITLDTRMKVSAHAASMPSTNIHLRTSDTISVREAIPALIVRSANDVAAVVAETLGGNEAQFGQMMTNRAKKLGMHSTTFRNASGLPNSAQKTTARDMAKLSTRLIKDFPQHYHYFSTQSFSYKGVTYNSHNRMVRNTPGVDGLKTGFIRASGFNVATSARRSNRRVVAVVMGGHTAAARDQHMTQLLDRSFNQTNRPAQAASVSNNIHTAKVSAIIPPAKIDSPKNRPDSKIAQQAVTKVVAPKSSISVTSPEGWAVQIGSYQSSDRAHAHAQAAARWIPGEIAVTEVGISTRKLYRARFVGLQEAQARNACQSLARQGMECLVVRS
ncbi:MAG: D-alanyl-D-alanine carboxypeptidase [Nitrosomonas sp.]|nr:MAG: D-alanyl-D-alanine carboxypeptidase [Nitrosomonas sp.]